MRKLVLVLLIISIPIFILLLNLNLHIYNEKFYLGEFEKNNVYASLEKEKVIENYNLLIDYFKDKGNLDQSFFNAKEKSHLVDVRNLIRLSSYMLYFSGSVLLLAILYFISKKFFKDLRRGLLMGSIATMIILGVFLLLALFDFANIFLWFHLSFFSNDLWILNPETDNLIVMFPFEFFYDSAVAVLLNSLITSAIIFLPCIILKFLTKSSAG